jgi:serine/threonine protein phosphatase PrpC
MSKIKEYLENLFRVSQIPVKDMRAAMFQQFADDDENKKAVEQIQANQQMLISKWQLKNRISDIQQQQVFIPNGTVNKAYEAKIDFIKLGWNDIVYSDFEGLEGTGLVYDKDSETISGTPLQSGDIKIVLKFRVSGEAEDSVLNEKKIPIVINPDPKSLWKNIESDKNDPHWKPDDITSSGKLSDRNIVVASKRGRSHANVGSFRDDDFVYADIESTGWGIVAVADGAGSSKLARKASEVACQAVVDFANEQLNEDFSNEFGEIITNYKNEANDETQKRLSHFVYNIMSKAAHNAHQKTIEAALKAEVSNKDFYTTLIFTFFKKYEFGYAILSFGVGDCPIALLNKDQTEVTLMNWLDVGEFGGGTRFITMPEIFSSDKFTTRFKFKLVEDFSYLFLMTDGIYDPKFVVEANLEKIEKWNEFIEDLTGKNEDNISVNFNPQNSEITAQLSSWMDFWSPGNHDDRTLAIVY